MMERFQSLLPSAGSNNSIGLPSRSSTWVCLPPGPTSISFLKCTASFLSSAIRAGKSCTGFQIQLICKTYIGANRSLASKSRSKERSNLQVLTRKYSSRVAVHYNPCLLLLQRQARSNDIDS